MSFLLSNIHSLISQKVVDHCVLGSNPRRIDTENMGVSGLVAAGTCKIAMGFYRVAGGAGDQEKRL